MIALVNTRRKKSWSGRRFVLVLKCLLLFPRIRYEDNNIDEDEFWEVIKKTKRIQLIGGETWLIKQYVQILEKCVKEVKR